MIQKKSMLKRIILATPVLLSVVLGMNHAAQAAVVASVRPLGFIAAAIAEGITDTEVLLPDGASPHGYALKPSDIKRLQQADLVVWVGPQMEVFLAKPTEQLKKDKNLPVMTLPAVQKLLLSNSDELHSQSASDGEEVHHHHGQYNSHIWLSPEIAKQAAIAIHDRLLQQNQQNKDKLDANLSKFESGLVQTQTTVATMLRPVQGKGYFVFHDAYDYFEKSFSLTPLGHFTVNPEIQPGAQRLHNIRTQLLEQKAVCVFAEPQFRPAVIETVTQGTSVRQGTLDPLGMKIPLTADSYMVFLNKLAKQYLSCLQGN